MAEQRYAHVRALDRGLRLLVALNEAGRSDPAALARIAEIDRTTAYRLLETLEGLGYVSRSQSDGKYVLLPTVRNLSEGLTRSDKASRIVAEELFELLPHVLWPTDYATFERGWMVIRETTHRFSPYSVHRAMVGRRRPLIESALGRAMLAGAEPLHREEMLAIAQSARATDLPEHRIKEAISSLFEDYSRRGYAWAVDGAEQGISAIALPVKVSESVLGSVNLLFFTSAMAIETAAERFLPSLRTAVAVISARLQKQTDSEGL